MKKRRRLEPGQNVPSFRGKTADGVAVSLEAFKGRKVWLAFFRYASCPLCNLRVAQMIGRYDELTAEGLEIVAVVQSPPARMGEFMGTQTPPFPIVCDPSEQLYERFGVESSLRGYAHPKNLAVMARAAKQGFVASPKMDGTKTRLPADFLIDADGLIVDAFYASVISEHIPFDRVERFVR